MSKVDEERLEMYRNKAAGDLIDSLIVLRLGVHDGNGTLLAHATQKRHIDSIVQALNENLDLESVGDRLLDTGKGVKTVDVETQNFGAQEAFIEEDFNMVWMSLSSVLNRMERNQVNVSDCDLIRRIMNMFQNPGIIKHKS